MSYAEFSPSGMQTYIVTVESYGGRIPRGTVENAFLGEEYVFSGIIDLVTRVESMMDSAAGDSGLRASESRPGPGRREPGGIAAFRLDILFRQNASWQGGIMWLDKRKSAQFRSVLELILLIDSALSAAKE